MRKRGDVFFRFFGFENIDNQERRQGPAAPEPLHSVPNVVISFNVKAFFKKLRAQKCPRGPFFSSNQNSRHIKNQYIFA